MSFGAGHVADMINRMKQNRAQRSSKKSKFRASNRASIYSDHGKQVKNTSFKTLSKKELIAIKKQIRESAGRERKREKVLLAIFLFFGFIALCYLLIWA